RDNYELSALQAFTDADIIIGQFGIGSDGHIAGILPASPAVTSLAFVAAYTHPPYERLTLTGHALRRVTAAYVLAFGADKQVALNALETKSLTYSEQPSQILKELPEAYVFSDQIGHRHGA
ncbi:6-phosphogluconolactonase, partial [Polaromonas sp.]|nr:6-phosphogluconolactonase [Candidatus Saccharibacteria bacterium]